MSHWRGRKSTTTEHSEAWEVRCMWRHQNNPLTVAKYTNAIDTPMHPLSHRPSSHRRLRTHQHHTPLCSSKFPCTSKTTRAPINQPGMCGLKLMHNRYFFGAASTMSGTCLLLRARFPSPSLAPAPLQPTSKYTPSPSISCSNSKLGHRCHAMPRVI